MEKRKLIEFLAKSCGHIVGIVFVGFVMSWMVVGIPHITLIVTDLLESDVLRHRTYALVGSYLFVSMTIWFGFVLLGQTLMTRRAVLKTTHLRRTTGTTIVETLVVLPVFFLLTFGMAQLSINQLAGILANVAVYEAGRSAWVWMPESEVGRLGVDANTARDKVRIAAALVMMPVAPGEFMQETDIGANAEKTRIIAIGAHIPFGGTLQGALGPDTSNDIAGLLSLNPQRATRRNQSMWTALDGNNFIVRTARKFTNAYNSTEVTVDGNHRVTLAYHHMNAMPLVGRVFGSFNTIEGREGYYSTYNRTFGLTKQIHPPNVTIPVANANIDDVEGGSAGDLSGLLGL